MRPPMPDTSIHTDTGMMRMQLIDLLDTDEIIEVSVKFKSNSQTKDMHSDLMLNRK